MIALLLASLAHAEPNQVSMTLSEFLQLYEQSKTRPPTPSKAPRDWAIDSARYVGEVKFEANEPKSAVFQARFHIENLTKDGWARIPILPGAVAVRAAKLGGADAPLTIENGWYVLVTDRKGAFDLDVDLAAAVETSQGASGFAFELAPSGATTLQLSVPSASDLSFDVANAKISDVRTVGAQRVLEASLPATGSLAVTWQTRAAGADEQPPRLYAQVDTLAAAGEGLLSATATVQETILFHGVDSLQVKIPEGVTVLDVRGSGLRDWTVEGGVLTAQLGYAAEGAYSFQIAMEQVIGEKTEIAVPVVVPLGVERTKGFVGVQAIGTVEVAAGAVQATPVDVRTLPATLLGLTDQPILLAYKYLGSSASIPLTLSEHEEVDVLVTLIDQAQATTMYTADGRRLTQVAYQVRNNRRQFLRLAMPKGAELWSASVAGRPVQPALAADGRLLLPLVRSAAAGGSLAAFGVDVVYVESGEGPDNGGRGHFEADLPIADAPTTYVGWTVYVPAEAKVKDKKREGSLRRVPYLSSPLGAIEQFEVTAERAQTEYGALSQANAGSLGSGAAPVKVSLPLEGQAFAWEKLLALDERLWVAFDYKGLKP
jgi:hypothetical protein